MSCPDCTADRVRVLSPGFLILLTFLLSQNTRRGSLVDPLKNGEVVL